MPTPMEFRILGPVRAHVDGKDVYLGGAKPKTLLSALLLADGQTVSDDKLGFLLWRHQPPRTSDAQIYTYVSRLRKNLGCYAHIVRQGQGYAIFTERSTFDWKEFTDLSSRGRKALADRRFKTAAQYFAEAIAKHRGPVLTDTTEFLVDEEAAPIVEALLLSTEGQIEAELALGRHAEILPRLFQLVARNPFRERIRVRLMHALQNCGRQSEALAVFHEGRRLLADELGIDPGPELREAYHSILTGSPRELVTPSIG